MGKLGGRAAAADGGGSIWIWMGRVMGDLLWGLYLVEPNGASTYNLMAIKHRARRQLLVVLLQNRHCLGFVIWLLLMR